MGLSPSGALPLPAWPTLTSLNPPPPIISKRLLTFIRLLIVFACLYLEHPLFPRKKMALLDTNDPHFFYDDIAAAREEDEAVVEDFHEAATETYIRGNTNVLVRAEEKHFKRMGTLPAALAVRGEGDKFVSVPINLAIIIKCHKLKTIANPHQLLVTTNATGIINSVHMRDQYVCVFLICSTPLQMLCPMQQRALMLQPRRLSLRRAQSKCLSATSCAGGNFNFIVPWARKTVVDKACLCLSFLSSSCH